MGLCLIVEVMSEIGKDRIPAGVPVWIKALAFSSFPI